MNEVEDFCFGAVLGDVSGMHDDIGRRKFVQLPMQSMRVRYVQDSLDHVLKLGII